MSEGDPTDNVLAAIASILDKSDTSDKSEVAHEPHEQEASAEHPEPQASSEEPEDRNDEDIAQPSADAAPPIAPGDVESGIYTKFGPGPLEAIRFKWATRRDNNGDYFVDETIGEHSHPLATGPMTRKAAIEFVDDQERLACERFEALRAEMIGGEVGRSRGEHS